MARNLVYSCIDGNGEKTEIETADFEPAPMGAGSNVDLIRGSGYSNIDY